MDKFIRDGKVAVLVSRGYGGWYTCHYDLTLVYHPQLVALVEQKRHNEIDDELIAEILEIDVDEVPYIGGVKDLAVQWVNAGEKFRIVGDEGYERVELAKAVQWIVA